MPWLRPPRKMDSVILMDGCGFPKFHALLSFAVFKGSTPLSEAKDCCLRGFPQGLFSKAGAETRALVLRQGPCMVMSLMPTLPGSIRYWHWAGRQHQKPSH